MMNETRRACALSSAWSSHGNLLLTKDTLLCIGLKIIFIAFDNIIHPWSENLQTLAKIMAPFKKGTLLLVIVVVLRCANGDTSQYWVNGENHIIHD